MKKLSHLILLFICLLSAPVISFAGTSDTIPDTNNVVIIDRSHSLFNNSITNPAYAGIFGGHNIHVNAGIDKPFFAFRNLYTPLQYNVAYDVALGGKKNNAIGVCYSYTAEGIINKTSGEITYARSFNLTKNINFYHKMRFGVSVSFDRKIKNWHLTTFGDQIDPKYGFVWNTSEHRSDSVRYCLNFNFGAWYHNPFFYFGLAIKNITEPDESFYGVSKRPREYNISTGGNIKINNNFALQPAFNLSVIKGFGGKLSTYSPIIMGSLKNKYFLGLSYKDLNKITVHVGGVALNCIFLSIAYGISTNTELAGFGYPAYIGGDLRINIKNKPK